MRENLVKFVFTACNFSFHRQISVIKVNKIELIKEP